MLLECDTFKGKTKYLKLLSVKYYTNNCNHDKN